MVLALVPLATLLLGFVITPIVTVVLSAWLDDEAVGIGLVLGGLLVLAGVYVGALRRTAAPLG